MGSNNTKPNRISKYYTKELTINGVIEVVPVTLDRDWDTEKIYKFYYNKTHYYQTTLLGLLFLTNSNNWTVIEKLISETVNVDIQSNDNWSALMYLCKHAFEKRGNPIAFELGKLIIAKTNNIDLQNNSNWTALMILCRYAFEKGENTAALELGKLIISKSDNMDLQNNSNWTALMILCRYSFEKGENTEALELGKLIISKSDNMDLQNNSNWTALMLLCKHAFEKGENSAASELGKLIIAKSNNIDLQNNRSWTALMLLCKHAFEKGENTEALELGELIIAKTNNFYLSIRTNVLIILSSKNRSKYSKDLRFLIWKKYNDNKPEEIPKECSICFEKKVDTVIYPCRHACCCKSCVKSLENCPMCREKIKEKRCYTRAQTYKIFI